LRLEDVLRTLAEDLVVRGEVSASELLGTTTTTTGGDGVNHHHHHHHNNDDRMVEALLHRMPRLELGLLLMDKYIKYPRPGLGEAWLPLNVCALGRLYPWVVEHAPGLYSWLCG